MNRLMYSFLACLFLFNGNLKSQVTIGSGEPPEKGTLLQLKNLQKETNNLINATGGFGMPRVSLSKLKPESGAELATSIGASGEWDMDEHIGLTVYNVVKSEDKGCTPFASGIYIWNGEQWEQLSGDKPEYIKGSYAGDVAALKELRDANPNNTLRWTGNDPKQWEGVNWIKVCGEERVRGLVIENKNLGSANGIEKLYALVVLNCDKNQLSELNLYNNTELSILYCGDNPLGKLDVSNNAKLSELGCYRIQLERLDVSQNTKLRVLRCQGNQLKELDASKNTELENLTCDNNKLTILNISYSTKLKYLFCTYNQLSQNVINKFKNLPNYCTGNQVSEGFKRDNILPQYNPGTTTPNNNLTVPTCP